MRLKRTLVALAIAGSTVLTGCAGSNTDLTRGETNCDQDNGSQDSHDNGCATGTPTPANNT
jgi:predicted small secreted protein